MIKQKIDEKILQRIDNHSSDLSIFFAVKICYTVEECFMRLIVSCANITVVISNLSIYIIFGYGSREVGTRGTGPLS